MSELPEAMLAAAVSVDGAARLREGEAVRATRLRHRHERRAGRQGVGQDDALGGVGAVVGDRDRVGGVGARRDGGRPADAVTAMSVDGERIADREVGDGRAPVGGGLCVGELVGRPEAAVDGIDVDAAEVAGPAAAGEVVVVRLAGRRPARGRLSPSSRQRRSGGGRSRTSTCSRCWCRCPTSCRSCRSGRTR